MRGFFPRGDLGEVHHIEVFVQKFLADFTLDRVLKHVEGIEVLVFGIDAIGGKPATQAVGTVMHHGDGADDIFAASPLAAFGKDG